VRHADEIHARPGTRHEVSNGGPVAALPAGSVTDINHHGAWIITIARFIEVLRQANGIVAGITNMPWPRFLAFNALGAALWVGTWVSFGYLAGSHIDTIYHYITEYSLYVLIALAVLLTGYIAWHVLHRRHRATRGSP
jgi:membrane protein DedA with SNARE-associated domain